MRALHRLPLALAAALVAGCATYRPPFTQDPGAMGQSDPNQATLVVFWPPTSCDPAGYFTIATGDGRFLGNLSSGSPVWPELGEWMANLEPIVPDRAAGQAWLDANRASLESHLAVGEDRFAGLRPGARRLATIEPDDGALP